MQTQRPNLSARRAVRGFTLIEVLLVIVIIGMLATVLVVTIGGRSDSAKVDTTRILLKTIENKVEQYMLDVNQLPGEEGLGALTTVPADEKLAEGWKKGGPYLQESQLIDAWQNKINYEKLEDATSGRKFKVWSNGPDGQSATEDDVYAEAQKKST